MDDVFSLAFSWSVGWYNGQAMLYALIMLLRAASLLRNKASHNFLVLLHLEVLFFYLLSDLFFIRDLTWLVIDLVLFFFLVI